MERFDGTDRSNRNMKIGCVPCISSDVFPNVVDLIKAFRKWNTKNTKNMYFRKGGRLRVPKPGVRAMIVGGSLPA